MSNGERLSKPWADGSWDTSSRVRPRGSPIGAVRAPGRRNHSRVAEWYAPDLRRMRRRLRHHREGDGRPRKKSKAILCIRSTRGSSVRRDRQRFNAFTTLTASVAPSVRRAQRINDLPGSWDEGLHQLADQIRHAKGPVIMISRPLSGTLADVVSDFVASGKGSLYFYDPSPELALRAAMKQAFGIHDLPAFDLGDADYVCHSAHRFWNSGCRRCRSVSRSAGCDRGRKNRRGRFVHVEPRLSLTAASADRWLPIRPGMEGLLARGIGHILLRNTVPVCPRVDSMHTNRCMAASLWTRWRSRRTFPQLTSKSLQSILLRRTLPRQSAAELPVPIRTRSKPTWPFTGSMP